MQPLKMVVVGLSVAAASAVPVSAASGDPAPAVAAVATSLADLNGRDSVTIAYPTFGRVELGQGWSSSTGRPKASTCIDFAMGQSVPYQEIRSSVSRAIDDDLLLFSGSFHSSASVSGGIDDVVSGHADGSLNFDISHKSTAASDTYISSVTITNGLETIAQTKDGAKGAIPRSVHLTPDMEAVAAKEPTRFEATCGRYFVSGIVSGGTLSVVYRLNDSSYDNRIKLETAFKMGGSYLSFNANGNSDITTQIQNLGQASKVSTEVRISGGKSIPIPIGVDAAQKVITDFAASITSAPKPSFVVLTPYTELPNWRQSIKPEPPDLKTVYLHLVPRLEFVLRTIDEIKASRWAHVSATAPTPTEPPLYMTSRSNGDVRQEDEGALNQVKDAVLGRLTAIRVRIAELEQCDQARDVHHVTRPSCAAKPNETGDLELDDYAYRVLLPLPSNAVPPQILARLTAPDVSMDSRRSIYSALLYQFWVDRTASDRCEYLGECRKSSELARYRQLAQSSVERGVSITRRTTSSAGRATRLIAEYLPISFTGAQSGLPICERPDSGIVAQTIPDPAGPSVRNGWAAIRADETASGKALRDVLADYGLLDESGSAEGH